ncbi:putative ribonuclease H-like domain-containing protein [Tanacetum coccineum]|uniref:Ribonuclease H-like domain-containing protein n=1 Tax=Tanacetum coccineum TaxID=301880 RepID=A0ABQ4YY37_9ASTR
MILKGPQKPEISVSDENSSEHSTCQSNDSEGSCENTSEHSFETESESLDEPNEMSKSRLEVTNEKDVSAPNSKEVAPSCVSHIKSPRQPLKDNETHKVNRKSWNDMMKRELGEGYSFTKKKCFVCGSLSHLIKDCDYYEKKMAREAEVKRVVNTGTSTEEPCIRFFSNVTEWSCGAPLTFKMPDENQILLKVPRHHNMYSFDMKTPSPAKGFACLIAKATSDESKLWHRRLGHINFKNLNKLVMGKPCKAKLERLITKPLHTLHMDLFGPTSVKSINHASYCLVITDDCTRFCWVFFLASKDETSGILQTFIRQIENQLSHRVKIIRSDNGTEFKNRDMLEFCGNKGIKQEYSNARTPQQNGVAERMNRTLIEAARTMLADSLLPTTFWAEAVSTACYIFNRVRVTKPQHKTPYELLFGHKPIISYIRPFGCHVTILDTLSVLGKFDRKSDEGFLVGESANNADEEVELIVVPSAVKIPEEKDESRATSKNLKPEETLTEPQTEMKDSLTNHKIQAFRNELEEIAPKAFRDSPENNTTSTYYCYYLEMKSTSWNEGDWHKWVLQEIKEIKGCGCEDKLVFVAQGYTQEEGIDYDEVFAPVARIEAIRFMSHNPGFVDHDQPIGLYGGQSFEWTTSSHRALGMLPIHIPRKAGYKRGHNWTRLCSIKREKRILMLVHVYVDVIILDSTQQVLGLQSQAEQREDSSYLQDKSMIGSLMYLTASRPDIMYAVCVCSRFQVTPKTSHLNAVKRIFKYLKGKPHLGLWYPRESPFDLEAFSDSDYGGSNLDRKSTTGGCQFLGQRLISWQCKKQTIVATSTTEAEYVAAANCCGQVLWVQNQLLDYGFNFMNTKIHIDNESTIYIMKNPVYHSKTKHIEIRHYFLKIVLEKKHHKVEKVHTAKYGVFAHGLKDVKRFAEIVDFFRRFQPLVEVSPPRRMKKLEGFLRRRNLVLSDSEEEEPKVQGRKSQDDPLDSSVQGLVTPPTTKVNTSGEEQVEEISLLTRVRSKEKKKRLRKKGVSAWTCKNEVDAGAEQVNTASAEQVNTASAEQVSTAEGVNTGSIKLSTVSEQVSTVGTKESTSSQDKGQREGKAPMLSEETPKKSKEQILQEEASLAEAIRLDTLQKEEVAKQVHLDSLLAQRIAEEEELNEQQKKRKAQVQFEAQHYTNEDWDLIRSNIEANAELSKSMLGSELQGEDFAKKMVDLVNQRKKYFAEERARAKRNKPMTQSQLKTYMMNYLKNQGTWKLSQLKKLSFEEVKEEFDKLVKQVESFAPISFEATKASLKRFGKELQTKNPKRLKDDEAKDDEPTKKSGKRRKQMARKGLHTSVDKNDSEDSDEVGEQEESVTGTKTPINPIPVDMKTPSVATYKIIKQGEKGVYQIVREDGTDI